MYPASHDAPRLLASPPPTNPGNQLFNVHTVLIALRCWWHIAVPLGLLLAAGAGAIVYYMTEPTYTASAWLRIRERPLALLSSNAAEDPRKFVNNQIQLLRSPPVLGQVTSDPAVARAPELVEAEDPVGALRSSLRVQNQGGSDFYEIKFTSTSPEHAKLIVNKVADEYIRIQQGHDLKSSRITIEKLVQQQTAQQADVKRLFDRYEALAKKYAGKAEVAIPAEKEDTAAKVTAASLRSQLTAAEVEQVIKQAQIEAEEELFRQESFEVDPIEVANLLESLPEVRAARDMITAKRKKAEEHRQRSVDPSRNTMLAQLEREIQQDEAVLAKTLEAQKASLKEELEKTARAKRQMGIEQMKVELKRLEATTRFLSGRIGEQQKERAEVEGDRLQVELAQTEYEQARAVLDQLSSRILTMQIEQQAPERVEIFEYASTPTRPDELMPYKKMGIAGMAAMLVPFALAIGIEILFRRVSSRQQLEQASNIAVVAEVTSLPARPRSRRIDAAPNRERQLFEESIDGLRTCLSLMDSMRGRKALAITSAISREGKTSLAAQLAASIAASTHRPTLLIDGDMRAPDIHRIFDIELGPGLCEVLRGKCPLEEAIETGFSETLHLLTAGNLTGSPHRILGDGAFAELLEKLRGMYDYIVIDTPPILAASESLLMARAADAAVLCVRRDYSRVDQVTDAFGRLRSAGVKTAGAVLNGIPPRHYAYRYGSYYYTRNRQSAEASDLDSTASEVTAG